MGRDGVIDGFDEKSRPDGFVEKRAEEDPVMSGWWCAIVLPDSIDESVIEAFRRAAVSDDVATRDWGTSTIMADV